MTDAESMQQPVRGAGNPEVVAAAPDEPVPPAAPHPAPTPTPPQLAPTPAPTAELAATPTPPRSVFWPTVWLCGALVWSYVVLGQLVIEANFPEALAWMVVAGVYAGVWVRAHQGGSAWRTWAPGVLALLLFVFEIALVSSFLGTSRRSVAAAVGMALGLFGIAQFFVGRSQTAAPRLELHRNQRIALIVLWVIVAGCTAVVLLSMLS